MFWNEEIPVIEEKDINGKNISVKLIAGEYKGTKSLDPLPASWAYDRKNHVGIWIIEMEPEAQITLPAVSKTINRMLYNYNGSTIVIDGNDIKENYYAELTGDKDILICNGNKTTKLLLLEGEPIKEPIAAQGPFVMNTMGELRQAFTDYQQTQFGGWQWDNNGPVNEKKSGRFASYNNGERIDFPPKKK